MWIVLLLGCWEPDTTGEDGMVGVLLAPNGQPLAGVTVSSEDAEDVTDPKGHFAVSYKEPSQFVHLGWENVWYTRLYAPADDGQTISLQMPKLVERTVRCTTACTGELTWKLGERWSAQQKLTCPERGDLALGLVPESNPEGSCGEQVFRADKWSFGTPKARIALTLPEAAKCSIFLDGEPAESPLQGSEPHILTAICDGLPAVPTELSFAKDSELRLNWEREGASVDLLAVAPHAKDVTVEFDEHSLRGAATVLEGMLRLPELKNGNYVLRFDEAAGDPPVPAEPNVLYVRRTDESAIAAIQVDGELPQRVLAQLVE